MGSGLQSPREISQQLQINFLPGSKEHLAWKLEDRHGGQILDDECLV